MEAFEDDDEFVEDYKDGSSSHDALLRKIGSKSTARQTKRQIRIDYYWDGKEANIADSVSSFVKEYVFPRFKFLKDGWMDYDEGQDSFSTFVQGKVQIPEGAEYKDQWERVICLTIQAKYVTIRCNLNNEIQRTYKSKFIQLRTMLFQHY